MACEYNRGFINANRLSVFRWIQLTLFLSYEALLAVQCVRMEPLSQVAKLPGGDAMQCQVALITPDAPAHAGLLAEPYKNTRFEVKISCPKGTGQGSLLATNLAVLSKSSVGHAVTGRTFVLNFTTPGAVILEVALCPTELVSPSNSTTAGTWCTTPGGPKTSKFEVAVTYVRREIRELSIAERKQFFDATKVMAKFSTKAGQKIFGPGFMNYYELVAIHAASVLSEPCDVGHFGPAFTPFHRVFVRRFEMALQSINPCIALPFWDYAIEAEMEDFRQSELFAPYMYGSATGDPDNTYVVVDGQFAKWKVLKGNEAKYWAAKTWTGSGGTLGPSRLLNPYGFFRGPENSNNGGFLTRFPGEGAFPTRANMRSCLSLPTFGEFVACLDYSKSHPGPHIAVGGQSGVPDWAQLQRDNVKVDCSAFASEDLCQETYETLATLAAAFRAHSVRESCLICNTTCSDVAMEGSSCACTLVVEHPRCDPDQIARRMLKKFFLTLPDFMMPGLGMAKFGLEAKAPLIGDYLDLACAPTDPLFWIHHTNVDRLATSWRWANPYVSWKDVGFTWPGSDAEYYPDYLSTTNIISSNGSFPGVYPPGDNSILGYCPGHGLYDYTAYGVFKGTFPGLPTDHGHTNFELLKTFDTEIFHPQRAPFVYSYYEAVDTAKVAKASA